MADDYPLAKIPFWKRPMMALKTLRGNPAVHIGVNELMTLSQLHKTLAEQAESPAHVQHQQDQDTDTLAERAYKYFGLSPAYYACVMAIANAAARVPLIVEKRDEIADLDANEIKHQWTRVFDDRIDHLLNRPNPYQTGYDLREETSAYLSMCGVAYWEKLRYTGDGEPPWTDAKPGDLVGFAGIRPDLIEPRGDRDNLYTRFKFAGAKIGVADAELDADDVVVFRGFSPTSNRVGVPPFGAAVLAVEELLALRQSQIGFWRNGAVPGMLLMTDKFMSGDAINRMIAQFEARHKGKAKRFKTAVLHSGLKAEVAGWSPKDLDVSTMVAASREDVYLAFGIVPAVLGQIDEARFKNIDEQLRLFETFTMDPKRVRERGALDLFVVDEIAALVGVERARFAHDTSGVQALQPDKGKRSARVVSEFRAGIIKRSVAQSALEHEVDEEADGYVFELQAAARLPTMTIEATAKADGDPDTYTIPDGAKGNAQQVLDWLDEHGDDVQGMRNADGSQGTGWDTARTLAAGGSVSLDKVRQIAAWFARHGAQDSREVDAEHEDEPWKDAGYVSWLGWGGDTARAWASEIIERVDGKASKAGGTLVPFVSSAAKRD